ncbi:MAG TPA: glycine cleavage system protein GcvH [Pirellulaceae bacterium]|nr:glycine cleavage system protein GcvH [Pirellulaceae bacterium]HMO93787.1 glycine cleavage system protein GcvH [Pirellulaceae bacterium]HMP70619.1 glycine cleavage system protein GcvH [Pirellulaceae bacterium]
MKPEELLYAETHEWVHVADSNGEKIATVGISAFAVEQLTDLVFMELPESGSQVSAGNEFGEVESVKAVSPLYSPVDGEVVAVNSSLPENLEILNSDPYEQGWMIKVRLKSEASLGNLLDYSQYQKQCSESG